MTWVWGLGPELLQVKRRLPPEGGDPYSELEDPGKRAKWVSLGPLRSRHLDAVDEDAKG